MDHQEAGRHVSRLDFPPRVGASLTSSVNSSDADSDVLADYVLALIRSEDTDEEVRANAEENLKDFLRDGEFSKADTPY
jgi:hypothetical protein